MAHHHDDSMVKWQFYASSIEYDSTLVQEANSYTNINAIDRANKSIWFRFALDDARHMCKKLETWPNAFIWVRIFVSFEAYVRIYVEFDSHVSALQCDKNNKIVYYATWRFLTHTRTQKLLVGFFGPECIPARSSFNMWESGLWSYVILSIVSICWRLLIVVVWAFRRSTKKTELR